MSHSLDDARLKIVWAQQHLEKTKREIARYVDTSPHVLRRESNPDDGRWTTGPKITAQPDDALSLLVGDFLTNCRAAIDYVMFQIALRWFDPRSIHQQRPSDDQRISAV